MLWLCRWKAYLVFPSSLSKVIHSSSLIWLRLVNSDKVSTRTVRSSFCSNVATSKKLLSAITRPGETAGPLHMLSCCMPHPHAVIRHSTHTSHTCELVSEHALVMAHIRHTAYVIRGLVGVYQPRPETDAPRALLAHL